MGLSNVPSLSDLPYIMINVITHNQHNKHKNKNTNTMISPNCWLPVALIL